MIRIKIPKISIIIPFYNVEKYIAKCIDSILTQTFTDFECILVNDGSPDNSPEICNEYAKKDERIKVIHKENGGVSSARNAGLNIAQGKWITFVDSDDWINDNYLKIMYDNAIKYDCDLSICGMQEFNEDGNITKKNELFPVMCFDKNNAKKTLLDFKYFTTSAVCKLVKTKYIRENEIIFDIAIKICEDGLFWFEIIDKIDKIVYDSTPCYNYLRQENSATCSENAVKNYMNVFAATKKMAELEKNRSVKRKIKSYEVSIANNWCYSMVKNKSFNKKNYSYYLKIVIKNIVFYFLDGDIPIKHKVMALLALNPFLYKKLMEVIL